MGISPIELRFLAAAHNLGVLSQAHRVLELGDSELVQIPDLPATLSQFLNTINAPNRLLIEKAARLHNSVSDYQRLFVGAKLFYEALFSYNTITAVDAAPGPQTVCRDLNYPTQLGTSFDVVINNGTSEHVFNIANVFKFIHDHTMVGGTMIHWTPMLGWLDHGFYNIQPGFFFDLARANRYELSFAALCAWDDLFRLQSPADVACVVSEPRFSNAMIGCVLKRTNGGEFKIPFQGIYRGLADFGFAPERSPEQQARPPRGTNIARGRPACQSSVSRWSYYDDPALDAAGANNGIITGHYGFHTEIEHKPWWQVDLQEEFVINEIRVYNRISGGCGYRTNSIEVLFSEDGRNWTTVYSNEGRDFAGADGSRLIVELVPPRMARFVRLQLNAREYLHLDEVEVYGANSGAMPDQPGFGHRSVSTDWRLAGR